MQRRPEELKKENYNFSRKKANRKSDSVVVVAAVVVVVVDFGWAK
jgi:hypothetical protein